MPTALPMIPGVTPLPRPMSASAPQSLPRLTPSGVGDLACPRKFKTLRIDRAWPGTNAPILGVEEGKAIHETLRLLYQARRGHVLPMEQLEALARIAVYKRWYPDDFDRDAEAQRVAHRVAGYVVQECPEEISGTIHVERWSSFTFRLDGRPLFEVAAQLDRTLARIDEPRTLVVRDYKSGRPKINLSECFIVLWVAARRYKPLGYDRVELELDWIDEDGRVARDVVRQEDVRGVHLVIVEAALKVLHDGAGEWPACPGDSCLYCPIKSTCQADALDDQDLARGQDVF